MSTGKYIVVFKEEVSKEEVSKYAEEITTNGGELSQRFYEDGILNGFSAAIPEAFLANFKNLQASKIDYIEEDSVVTTQS